MEPAQQNEVQFYKNGDVVVTQSRYMANSTTYAIRNISSVRLNQIPAQNGWAILILAVGSLMLIGDNGIRTVGILLMVFAIILLIYIKDQYTVRISTNAGETNTITSKNSEQIQEIVDALNEAIIYGG